MILPLLLSLSASAVQVPQDVRDDATMVLSCSSMRDMDVVTSTSGGLVAGALRSAGMLRQIGLDPTEPFALALVDIDGNLLPGQILYTLPPGGVVSPFVQMMPGSPRVQQQGRQVQIRMGGARSGAPTGLAPLLTKAADSLDGPGCVMATGGLPGSPMPSGMKIALAQAPDGRMRVVVEDRGTDGPRQPTPAGTAFFVTLLEQVLGVAREPAPPRRRAWASTASRPTLALRLNGELDVLEVVRSLQQQPIEDDSPLHRVVVEPGSEIGVWMDGDRPQAALVLTVRKPRTVRWWPGRLAAQIRKDGQEVEQRGRVFGVQAPNGTRFWITARRRRLIVANSYERAALLRKRRKGQAWFDADEQPIEAPGIVLRSTGRRQRIGRIQTVDGLLLADLVPVPTDDAQAE